MEIQEQEIHLLSEPKEPEPINIFWLSYDLGLIGDYSSLYRWLDKQKAKECGYNFAFFKFANRTDDAIAEIKNSLCDNIKFNKNDRVYLISYNYYIKKHIGNFIIGSRKREPWEGYFETDGEQYPDL